MPCYILMQNCESFFRLGTFMWGSSYILGSNRIKGDVSGFRKFYTHIVLLYNHDTDVYSNAKMYFLFVFTHLIIRKCTLSSLFNIKYYIVKNSYLWDNVTSDKWIFTAVSTHGQRHLQRSLIYMGPKQFQRISKCLPGALKTPFSSNSYTIQ